MLNRFSLKPHVQSAYAVSGVPPVNLSTCGAARAWSDGRRHSEVPNLDYSRVIAFGQGMCLE